jgi:lipopolysaccharide heptosyltransferase II
MDSGQLTENHLALPPLPNWERGRGEGGILLTRLRFIGDVVLTTPAVENVRRAYPNAHVAYLADRTALPLLAHNPHINELIGYDLSRPSLLEQARVGALLRKKKFDLVIDFFGNPRSALVCRLSGAQTRVGPERKGRGSLYTVQVRDDGVPKPAVDYHNATIAAAGIPVVTRTTHLYLTERERVDARRFLHPAAFGPDKPRPMVALHVGASWPAKRWLPERFAQLADRMHEELGADVILIAGLKDQEAAETCRKSAKSNPLMIPPLPLRQTAAVIASCKAFVGNDAGPMHISAALGVPTVGIFGPGEENVWFPYDPAAGHHALRKDVPCHPCHLDFCNKAGAEYMQCMTLLTTDEVFDVVRGILSR